MLVLLKLRPSSHRGPAAASREAAVSPTAWCYEFARPRCSLKGEGGMEIATAQATKPKLVGPQDGKLGFLGSIGVRFMIDGDETDQGFSLVEHPMSPRALAAPLHRHNREDEYSYVLEGKVGALLGDEVLVAEPGDLVFKPRD